MPGNRDISIARKYHNATKHSYASIRTNPHTLDWDNKPLLFKIYPTLDVMRLPREARQTGVSALSAVGSTGVRNPAPLDLETLAQLLFLSAGITKTKKYPGGETFFRAAACTGALYEFELYIVSGDLPDLPAGVYHFGVAEFGLRQLRKGDFRRVLAEATADHKPVTEAPVTIICTGTYWRNAWKYQARTYRHFGWDNGTILANMLATSVALELPARVVMGFVDEDVNRLLGLDTDREIAFSLVALGLTSTPPPEPALEIEPIRYETLALSASEVDYPAMRAIHAASSLESVEQVLEWRGRILRDTGKVAGVVGAPPMSATDTIEQVILRRGS